MVSSGTWWFSYGFVLFIKNLATNYSNFTNLFAFVQFVADACNIADWQIEMKIFSCSCGLKLTLCILKILGNRRLTLLGKQSPAATSLRA